jgi:hypothetical protein
VAAYSLRLLNTDYVGDAVVVRRASDNTTQSIGFVDGELDTDTLNTFCSGTDGFITTWLDQSGNGFDATNTTASQQPKIYDNVNGVITENGRPSLDFTGDSTGLQVNFNSFLSQPNNIFVIHKKTEEAGILFDGITFANRHTQTNDFINAGISLNNAYPYPEINKQNLLNVLFNETNSESRINGVLQATGDTGDDILTGFSLGTRLTLNFGFDGNMQEFIFYNSDESSNRTGIELNINTYYSIY